jgi:hypothetical protein
MGRVLFCLAQPAPRTTASATGVPTALNSVAAAPRETAQVRSEADSGWWEERVA